MLFGPPPAGARRGRLWGCAPFSAPLASPPKHPAGAFQHPTFREGCAASAPGASSLRSAISLRAAQCQRALSPCVRGRKRYAYPPHAQREGYALRERPKGIYTAPNRPPLPPAAQA